MSSSTSTCNFLKVAIQRRMPDIAPVMERVIFDRHGRCAPQHQLDQLGYMTLPPTVWDELRVMTLVTELVHLIGSFVEVKKVEWLREDVRAVGCVLPFMTDTVFIRAANLLHPLDAIGTTLHELGHVFVRGCGHFHRPGESHCEAWKDATKLLTVLLWRVSRIYVLCCFVLVYIYIYIISDWIYNVSHSHNQNNVYLYFFNLQMPHLDEWPILNQLTVDLGRGWCQKVVHGVTFCDKCPAYTSEEGKVRLAIQKVTLDVDYISTLDIRILCLQERLRVLLQQQRQQQRGRETSRKRQCAQEAEVSNKKRRMWIYVEKKKKKKMPILKLIFQSTYYLHSQKGCFEFSTSAHYHPPMVIGGNWLVICN